jgi:hypothetical protein
MCLGMLHKRSHEVLAPLLWFCFKDIPGLTHVSLLKIVKLLHLAIFHHFNNISVISTRNRSIPFSARS